MKKQNPKSKSPAKVMKPDKKAAPKKEAADAKSEKKTVAIKTKAESKRGSGTVVPKEQKEDLRKSKSSKKKMSQPEVKESAKDLPNFDEVQEAEVSIGFQDPEKSMAEEQLLKQESIGSKPEDVPLLEVADEQPVAA